MKCGKKINLDLLEIEREQLWAEAVERYKQNEQTWLSPDEHNLACIEQKERMIEDIVSEKILHHAEKLMLINLRHDFSIADLVEALGIPIQQRDAKFRLRITDCLVANGFVEYMPRVAGKQKRHWKRPSDTELVSDESQNDIEF